MSLGTTATGPCQGCRRALMNHRSPKPQFPYLQHHKSQEGLFLKHPAWPVLSGPWVDWPRLLYLYKGSRTQVPSFLSDLGFTYC